MSINTVRICVECNRPYWSYVHAPDHPANRGNEDITHAFVKPELVSA